MRDSGIVHQDVEPSAGGGESPDHLANLGAVGDITGDRLGREAAVVNQLRRAAGCGVIHVEHRHVRALPREHRRNGRTNSRTATGDDRDLAGQLEHATPDQ